MANTGYEEYSTLRRVVEGGEHDGEPLDVNGHLCSVSGLPQATKSNTEGTDGYIPPVYKPEECEIPEAIATRIWYGNRDATVAHFCDQPVVQQAMYNDPTPNSLMIYSATALGHGVAMFIDEALTIPYIPGMAWIATTDILYVVEVGVNTLTLVSSPPWGTNEIDGSTFLFWQSFSWSAISQSDVCGKQVNIWGWNTSPTRDVANIYQLGSTPALYLGDGDVGGAFNRWYDYNGTTGITATGLCTPLDEPCNEEESRVFYKTCGDLQIPYTYTITAGTHCAETEEDVDALVEADFLANGQDEADSEGVCPGASIPNNVWVVSGSPCTGPRVATTLYQSTSDGKLYIDAGLTTLANVTFFTKDDTKGNYVIVINGVPQDPLNNSCPVTAPLYYADMGNPADISVYDNWLLACYPDKGVVMKYDTSTGTNPVGTIVAGEMGKTDTGPYSPAKWLNMPMLVEWRNDGERFVVFSGGFYKTLKIFLANGTYANEGAINFNDSEWDYNEPGTTPSTSRWETPSSTSSIIGLMTMTEPTLANFWIPTAIEFRKRLNNESFDVVFLSIWNKTIANHNRYKLYAITILQPRSAHGKSLTALVADSEGYADEAADLIRGFRVIKQTQTDLDNSRFLVAIVSPRSWTKSGNDKYRYYELQKVDIRINGTIGLSGFRIPSVYPSAMSDPTAHRINGDTRGVWKNNVKAEVNFSMGKLIVVVKSSSDSLWNMIIRTVNTPIVGLILGVIALQILTEVTLGWWTTELALTLFGLGGFTPAGIVIGILVIVGVALLAPPRQRYVGSSGIFLTFSTYDVSTLKHENGSYDMTDWVSNNLQAGRTTYTNIKDGDAGWTLYSREGRVIMTGNWYADDNSGSITL